MPARIAILRVQNHWAGRSPHMRCVARLTRPLSRDEIVFVNAEGPFSALDDIVTYTCRPEDVEEAEHRLSMLLHRVYQRTQAGAQRQPQLSVVER